MKRSYLVFVALLLTSAFAKNPEVVYRKADDALNQKATERLLELFDTAKSFSATSDLFGTVLFCPAGLWEQIMKEQAVASLKKGVMVARVPRVTDGKVTRMEKRNGKVFQGKDEVEAFWNAFCAGIKVSGKPLVRKLTDVEIDVVWTMIPFPIEEPAFIMEWKDHKILVFLSKELKILYIDELQAYIDGSIWKRKV